MGMIAKAHFDADTMSKRQQALEDRTRHIHQLMKIKRHDLDFRLELHRFTREADTVITRDLTVICELIIMTMLG